VERTDPFVTYLEGLKKRGRGTATLAALRRGVGRQPGTVPEMHQYVVPWLPESAPPWVRDAHYLVASLFAYHGASVREGNMGDHFRALVRFGESRDAVERRFSSLLGVDQEELYLHLWKNVAYLKGKGIGINWRQLLYDAMYWGHSDGFVQEQWAAAFWSRRYAAESEN
jgi:CRISPR system Cascade subunit CasB